ncbi:hypothetical protein Agub_g2173, partial [Astrephomene gubernaculifera]
REGGGGAGAPAGAGAAAGVAHVAPAVDGDNAGANDGNEDSRTPKEESGSNGAATATASPAADNTNGIHNDNTNGDHPNSPSAPHNDNHNHTTGSPRSRASRLWIRTPSLFGSRRALSGTQAAASSPGFQQAESFRKSLSRFFAGSTAAGRAADEVPSKEGGGGKADAQQKGDAGKLVASEDRATGTVSWRVYGSYCVHLGLPSTAFIAAALLAGQAVFLGSEWWLAMWARSSPEEQEKKSWLWVYGLLTVIVIILAVFRSAIFFEATLSAATSIHNAMAHRVLRAPLSFFHTNPSGRIVNRFSKDQGQVDDLLPSSLFDALQSSFQVLGALVLVCIAVPVILPVFLPLLVAFWWVRRRYITASREVKRWEAVTRSPVFASFSATLKGLPTIRAFGAAGRFNDAFLDIMTHNGNWYFAFISTARWIGVRLDAVAGSTLLAAALLAMAMKDSINTGVMALALTHVLQLTGLMQWVVRQTAEVENNMTSVERMLSYTRLPSEPPRVAEGGAPPPPGWPASGALRYENVTAVYRPGLPPVLRDISFELRPGTSCGVVGRTGSGKSSLMLTLFRLIDVTRGRILLDGRDTASLGLDALRRQLAIIPQDPVLFSGSLRSNLDPWRTHSDPQLWRVLAAVQLRAAVAAMPGGLDAPMAECGGNLSVGQRQLFCLARALLQDAKVLALDEATANVDRATDQLIQNALRSFAHGSSSSQQKEGEEEAGEDKVISATAAASQWNNAGEQQQQQQQQQQALEPSGCIRESDAGGELNGMSVGKEVAQRHKTLPGPHHRSIVTSSSRSRSSSANRHHEGRVLLVIAHRLDTIMDTDQLLVLAGGRLVESGPPGELA